MALMESQKCWDSKTVKTSLGTKNSIGTRQLKIQDVMKNKLPRSGNRATAITKSIGLFISKDMRPYSVLYHVVRIDHFTVVAKLPGLRMEARLPVTLF